MSENYENMSNEEIKEQLEWSDHHEFSYNYAIWAFEEINRLNNIINELEKYIKTEAKIELYKDKNGFRTFADSDDILNKLKELKENNK